MDVNIPTVTLGQQRRLAELNVEWQPIKEEYDGLQKKVEEYNALCRKMQIEKITIPEVR